MLRDIPFKRVGVPDKKNSKFKFWTLKSFYSDISILGQVNIHFGNFLRPPPQIINGRTLRTHGHDTPNRIVVFAIFGQILGPQTIDYSDVFTGQRIYGKLKADRPHPRDYPHTPH